jgi:hypothetical protein
VCLGHVIVDDVLREHDARDADDAMAVVRLDQAAVVDDDHLLVGVRFRKRSRWSWSPAMAGAWQRGRGPKSGQVWVRTPKP